LLFIVVMKILFLCRGNIGRSQIAEAFYNSLTHSKNAISAGTIVRHPGKTVEESDKDGLVVRCMREGGIDISQKVRKKVTVEMTKDVDNIIVMAELETVPEFIKKNKKSIFWEIKDPQGESYSMYCNARDEIKRRVKALIKQ